jgi:hypothetical protein
MKKQIKYKKFIIIFGAVLASILLCFIAARVIFPLPPERKLTITENKTLIATFTEDSLNSMVDITTYDDNNLLITAEFFGFDEEHNRYDEEHDHYIVYVVNTSGEIIRSFEPPFPVDDSIAFEDGNIAFLHYDGDTALLTEYTGDFEFVSEKICPVPDDYLTWDIEYSDSLLYSATEQGVAVFDRNLTDFEILADEEIYSRYLDRAYDKTLYLTSWYKEYTNDGVSKRSRYITTPYGEPTGFNLERPGRTVVNVMPGDSEYPFYGEVYSYSYFEAIFAEAEGSFYICGLTPDGKIHTLLLNDFGAYRLFYTGVPLGEKRYKANGEFREDGNGSDLFLYEYTAVYED